MGIMALMIDEASAQDLADRLAVQDVATEYTMAMDRLDWAAVGRLFTGDARFEISGIGVGEGPDGVVEVVGAVLRGLDVSQHLNGNHLVTVRGDQAEHTAYTIAQTVRRGTPGGDTYLVGARYEDRLRRTPDGWRFTHRFVTILWTEGNPAVVGLPESSAQGAR